MHHWFGHEWAPEVPLRTSTWWRHQMEAFSASQDFCERNPRAPADSHHKCQWCGALVFSLIFGWAYGWANNWDAGDLRRHGIHCDITLMLYNRTKKRCKAITMHIATYIFSDSLAVDDFLTIFAQKTTILSHCGIATPYEEIYLTRHSGNGLLLDSTKPLHEPILIYYQGVMLCSPESDFTGCALQFSP